MDQTLYLAPVQSVTPWGLLALVPLLPLLGAAWNALLGPWGQRRYGRAFVHVPAVGAMFGAFVVSLLAFGKLLSLPVPDRFLWAHGWRMLDVGSLSVDMALAMDPLSAVMALVVTGVGTLIHVYSVGYMRAEKSYWRYFSYLNLFCFAMLLLVLADGFIVMFIGWEGVGLCSYLLIGFWYTDPAKASAGMKAFVVNRVGDFGFILGLGLLFWTLGGAWGIDGYRADPGRLVAARVSEDGRQGLTVTAYPGATVAIDGEVVGESPLLRRSVSPGAHRVELSVGPRAVLSAMAPVDAGHETAIVVTGPTVSFRQLRDQLALERREGETTTRLRDRFVQKTMFGVGVLTIACLFLFLGAIGKSAQVPLFVWLPDAMAGPTPVSALIHAATMVTAGVYLIARLNFLFAMSPGAMTVIALVGAVTALFAATIGLFQHDIKKVLAYSTVSQLGFMFVGVGVGAYWAGVFHLVTHAFFKACLFLAAGSVIHGMHAVEHGEVASQDMRRMGGLAKVMPKTATAYWIACVAITAAPVPFLAGFWSKDEILWKAFTTKNLYVPGWSVWAVCSLAAACTAFYMWRSWFLTFHGEPREEIAQGVHESPASMVRVLQVLAVLSVVGGYGLVIAPAWAGGHPALESFLEPVTALSAPIFESAGRGFRAESHGLEVGLMLLSLVLALAGWAFARRRYRVDRDAALSWEMALPGHRLLFHGYFVDALYGRTVVPAFLQTRVFLAQFDRWVIDGLVNASATALRVAAWVIGRLDDLVVDGLVDALSKGTLSAGTRLRRIQTGRIQSYIYGILTGGVVIALVAYVVSGAAPW